MQVGEYRRDGYRVGYIRFARHSSLALVRVGAEFVGFNNDVSLGVRKVVELRQQLLESG
jgi:hypothetical protein